MGRNPDIPLLHIGIKIVSEQQANLFNSIYWNAIFGIFLEFYLPLQKIIINANANKHMRLFNGDAYRLHTGLF